jgi:hypothetical protein
MTTVAAFLAVLMTAQLNINLNLVTKHKNTMKITDSTACNQLPTASRQKSSGTSKPNKHSAPACHRT